MAEKSGDIHSILKGLMGIDESVEVDLDGLKVKVAGVTLEVSGNVKLRLVTK